MLKMREIVCKSCGSVRQVKNGTVRGAQRYLCKDCGCNFIERDNRARPEYKRLRALCVLLYSMG